MNNQEEFLKQMENLKVPEIDPAGHQNTVKMAIMNADRSAALGLWLIIVPCYFFLCVLMYAYYHGPTNWFTAMFNILAGLGEVPLVDFLAPLVLLVLPVVCIIINLLSIVHVRYQRFGPQQIKVNELGITIKLKPRNILLIVVSILILLAFMAFVNTESISIKN